MTINTVTHLNFRGDARAALAFYHSVFGGNQMLISYADAHNVQKPAEADQIMWGQVAADNGFHVMAYDVPSATPWNAGEIPFFVSIRGEDRRNHGILAEALQGLDRHSATRASAVGEALRDGEGPVRRHLGLGRRGSLRPVLKDEESCMRRLSGRLILPLPLKAN